MIKIRFVLIEQILFVLIEQILSHKYKHYTYLIRELFDLFDLLFDLLFELSESDPE